MVITGGSERPWADLDPAIATILRPTLPQLISAILDGIGSQLPTLGQDLAGPYGVALRRGIEEALEHFLTLLGADVPALDDQLNILYRSFGSREDRHGRTLETLLAAYRRGARGAWAYFASAVVDADVPTDQVIRLAEAIFAYIDELSAASTLGFAQAQVQRASHRDALRQRLAVAILSGEALSAPGRVSDLAAEAGWPLPDSVAAAVCPQTAGAEADRGSSRPLFAHPDVLLLTMADEVQAIIPAALLGRKATRATLRPRAGPVCVGTIRPIEEAPTSLAHARALAQLVAEGRLDVGRQDVGRQGAGRQGAGRVAEQPLVAAADHLPLLLIHADATLLADLTAIVLAPLGQVSESRREVMTDTLRAWLAHRGDRAAAAADLCVHPQTVSYRMTELRRLFGDRLEQPAARFALMLALESVGAAGHSAGNAAGIATDPSPG